MYSEWLCIFCAISVIIMQKTPIWFAAHTLTLSYLIVCEYFISMAWVCTCECIPFNVFLIQLMSFFCHAVSKNMLLNISSGKSFLPVSTNQKHISLLIIHLVTERSQLFSHWPQRFASGIINIVHNKKFYETKEGTIHSRSSVFGTRKPYAQTHGLCV